MLCADFIHYLEHYYRADTQFCVQFVSVSDLEVPRGLNIIFSNRFYVLCFIEKLDRCPICRSPITAFFRIRSEDYVTASNNLGDQDSKQKVSVNWIDALNDRLTDFLGFR